MVYKKSLLCIKIVPLMHKPTYSPIEWRTHQNALPQPYSSSFKDVYFSTDNGLLETDYVFLQGNKLALRWQQLPQTSFTIIETGFGTGLNFLCAAKLWLSVAPQNARLLFISTEKYPLSVEDITKALQMWPQLQDLIPAFLAQYEHALTNQTVSVQLFNNRLQLTLLFGDAIESLQTISNPADAWFLDGFSPAKNPDMWRADLYTQMARLSTATSTFATFTSAGNVRRGLQAAGFNVIKQAGFGKKREMLSGHFAVKSIDGQSK